MFSAPVLDQMGNAPPACLPRRLLKHRDQACLCLKKPPSEQTEEVGVLFLWRFHDIYHHKCNLSVVVCHAQHRLTLANLNLASLAGFPNRARQVQAWALLPGGKHRYTSHRRNFNTQPSLAHCREWWGSQKQQKWHQTKIGISPLFLHTASYTDSV